MVTKGYINEKKSIGFSPKIILHMVAIAFFMFGCVLLHAVYNYKLPGPMLFFGISIQQIIIFDSALLFVSLAFFIEFYLTFRPIHILKKK